MTVRNITGNLVDITGEILPNTEFTVIPETYVFGVSTDTVVFGDILTVTSDEGGDVSFDLYEGRYVGRISTNRGTKDFRLVVDSEGPWNLARLVGTLGDITPGLISQAFEAAAQAQGFANQAEQFSELAGENSRLEIGTVTTGAPGDPAEATITGDPGEQILNLTIPKGEKGDPGGLPPGGGTGQILVKASGEDFDTEWVDASGFPSIGGPYVLDVSEMVEGVLTLTPEMGGNIILSGHGAEGITIKGFGDACPSGYSVVVTVPRTIPRVGNIPNSLGSPVTFVDYRDHNTEGSEEVGFRLPEYWMFDGVPHRTYQAFPDASDAFGNEASIRERLEFVCVGSGNWEIVGFPTPSRGQNAYGWWQKNYDGLATSGYSRLYPTDINIAQGDGFRSENMEADTPIPFEYDGSFSASVATVNANTWISAGTSGEEPNRWRWRGQGFTTRTGILTSGLASGNWKPAPWTGYLIAHRGNNTTSDPENCIGPLDNLSPWVKGVEIDIRATSDGVPVLMHDATIDRTTSGTGSVNSISLAALQALDAGTEAGGGETVPTLAEYLAACEGRGFEVIFIDMKEYGIPLYTDVAQIVAESSVAEACIIKLENANLATMQAQAAAIRAVSTTVKIGRLSLNSGTVDDVLNVFDEYGGFVAVTGTGASYLTDRDTFGQVKQSGYLYGCSTQNDLERLAQCKRDNCYLIFTDIAGTLGDMFG